MIEAKTAQERTAKYYSRVGSWFGYNVVMKHSQHAGFWDENHADEKSAQVNFNTQVAKMLDLKLGMKILDAGSGQGVVATYLAKNFDVNVTGITITPREIQVANSRAAKMGLTDKTDFVLGDFAKTPFADNSFDRIYTTETLSHAADVAKVVREFARILKPGGKVVCIEYEIDHEKCSPQQNRDLDFIEEYVGGSGVRQFAPGQFMRDFRDAGFVKVIERDWSKNSMPTFERLAKISQPIAKIVRATHAEKHFVNTILAQIYVEVYRAGIFKFKAYTATKPAK